MPRGPATFKEADVKRAVKAVCEASGEPVRRVEIDRAGKIVIVVGAEPGGGGKNEWDEVQ